MNEILAQLRYGPNTFEVLKNGDHVICAVSGKNIPLENWNVELQEAYFSAKEAQIRYEKLNNK